MECRGVVGVGVRNSLRGVTKESVGESAVGDTRTMDNPPLQRTSLYSIPGNPHHRWWHPPNAPHSHSFFFSSSLSSTLPVFDIRKMRYPLHFSYSLNSWSESQNPDSWVMSWGYLPSNTFGHLTLEYTVCLWPESAMVAGLRERELIMVRHYKLCWSREIYVSPFAIWRLPFIFWIIKQKTFSYIPQWRE